MNEYPNQYTAGMPKTDGLAVTSLVLGILSVTFCNVVTGIPAIVCGHIARSRILQSNGAIAGGGLAIAGLVTGYISIGLMVLAIAWIAMMGAAIGLSIPFLQQIAKTSTVASVEPRIVTACNRYLADKGKFPQVTVLSGEQVDSDELFAALAVNDSNGKPYYDASGTGIHINGTPRDAHLEPMQVALDLNGDGKVDVNGTLVDGSVVVWSKGPNTKNEFGEGDDVKSWK
jgi:hypothetical protein